MKFLVALISIASVAAFAPAPVARTSVALDAKSKALPFLECPEKLDGTLVGDAGFDPMRISDTLQDLEYVRAAELKHGRISQLAIVGFLVEEKFHLPMFSKISSNPLDAVKELGVAPQAQIFLTLAIIEFITFNKTYDSSSAPGDFNFGASFLKNKSDAQVLKLKTQEITHCRLAMMAITGAVVQPLIFNEPLW